MTPKKSRLSPGVWTVLCLLLALCLWEWAAAAGHVNDYFFSRPSALWAEFLELVSSGLLAKHLSVTLQEAGLGLLFGGLFGTLAGLGLGLAPRVSRALTPLLTGLNGLPKLALGPVFIIWFGLGLRSKVIMSALMVFFIFVFNLYTGVRGVDPALLSGVRLLGHRGRISRLHQRYGLAALGGGGCVQLHPRALLRAGVGGAHHCPGRRRPPAGVAAAALARLNPSPLHPVSSSVFYGL